ncbi:BT0820 family HAD-type phosphatase [Gaoshiqia sp. Z1-71]|uniref:BT0820 family HAD-type phosphatase n=1 Tax=Gaoshiqia hydrogeniformans TaxID=3290090 RepID=UPI003BF79B38
MYKRLIIAVDFDGTIVEHKYPQIGKELPFAIQTLKMLQQNGHRLILWTCRAGRELEEAVLFCRERGLEFYAINKNYPEESWKPESSRKIVADLYLDDRIPGGLPSWTELYRTLHPETDYTGGMKESGRKWWIFKKSAAL